MSVAITIDLPETVFSAIRKSPSEFAAEMRLAAAVKWYPPFQSTADEIMEDLRHAD